MEQNRKSKKKIVLIVLIAMLAALAVGIAVRFMHSPGTGDYADTTTAAESVEASKPEEAVSEAETQTAAKNAWIGLYKGYLTERVKAAEAEAEDPAELEYYSPAHFSLIYLDDDAVPELVVSEDFYHAASATLVIIENGKTKTFENLGSYGVFQYKEKQGIVVTGYDGSGVSDRTVFRLEQGELKQVWSGSESHFYEDKSEYSLGDIDHRKEVSEAEYRKSYDANMPNGLTETLRDTVAAPPMTGKNVELYFRSLADRESVTTIRAYTELTFSGTVTEKQIDYYDNSEYYELILDEPMIVQFEDDEFPALISGIRISDNAASQGNHKTVQGHPVKEREFVIVY